MARAWRALPAGRMGRLPASFLGRRDGADLASIIEQLPTRLPFGRAGLSTLVGIHAGEGAFGSSPNVGTLESVLRADRQDDLDAMIAHVEEQARSRAQAAELKLSVELVEPFPATLNEERAVLHAIHAAKAAGLRIHHPPRPFPWSEDFGHASRRWPSALAGIGSGETHPPLHDAAYDFPDALLDHGVRVWWNVATMRP